MNILIIEDEPSVAQALADLLKKVPSTNIVDIAHDFKHGLDMASSDVFDVILVDIVLGHNNKHEGLQLCHLIRDKRKDIPIIVITGYHRAELLEKAFLEGANDYIKKPFNSHELQIRVRRWLLMTHKIETRKELKYGELSYSPREHEFYLSHERLPFTKKIKALMLIFMRHPDELLSEEYLQEKLWGDRDLMVKRNIRSNIQRLRSLLPQHSSFGIVTMRGEGYVLQNIA